MKLKYNFTIFKLNFIRVCFFGELGWDFGEEN